MLHNHKTNSCRNMFSIQIYVYKYKNMFTIIRQLDHYEQQIYFMHITNSISFQHLIKEANETEKFVFPTLVNIAFCLNTHSLFHSNFLHFPQIEQKTLLKHNRKTFSSFFYLSRTLPMREKFSNRQTIHQPKGGLLLEITNKIRKFLLNSTSHKCIRSMYGKYISDLIQTVILVY